MKNKASDIRNRDSEMLRKMKDDISSEADRIRSNRVRSDSGLEAREDVRGTRLSIEALMALDDIRFIEAAYQKLLLRDADADAASELLAQLRSGEITKEQLLFNLSNTDEGRKCHVSVEGFILSEPKAEWFGILEENTFIEALFVWLLGRQADEGAKANLRKQLESGMTKADVFDAIVNSAERKKALRMLSLQREESAPGRSVRYEDLVQPDDADFIENAYRCLLLRDAVDIGAVEFLLSLRRGTKSKSRILFELSLSEEGRRADVYIENALYGEADLSNLASVKGSDFIRCAFMWLLNRGATQDENSHFLSLMRQGVSKRRILEEIQRIPAASARAAENDAIRATVHDAPEEEGVIGALARREADSALHSAVNAFKLREEFSRTRYFATRDAFDIIEIKRRVNRIESSISATQDRIDGLCRQVTESVDEMRRETTQAIESAMDRLGDIVTGLRQQMEAAITETQISTTERLTDLGAQIASEARFSWESRSGIDALNTGLAAIRQSMDENRRMLEEARQGLAAVEQNAQADRQLTQQTRSDLEQTRSDLAQTLENERQRIREQLDDKASTSVVDKMTEDIGAVSREVMLAKWKLIDHLRKDTELPSDVLVCNVCGSSRQRSEYKTMESDCIFNGGHLTRYICPECGVVFGPSKFVDQGQKGIDEDYWVHYLGFSEGDSEYKEERAFRLLEPRKDKVYLDYGCGKWSKTLQKLRAEGYNVYGYEPYAPEMDNPYMITRKEDLVRMRFDGIFSNDVLEHFVDPVEDMKFMASLLMDEKSRMAHCTACYVYRYEYTRFHTHFFLGNSVNVLAEKAGLNVTGYVNDLEDNDFICYIYAPKQVEVKQDFLDRVIGLNQTERHGSALRIYEGGRMCGPYYTLPAGAYSAQLHIEDLSGEAEQVADYKITAEKGNKLIAQGKLKRGDNKLRWHSECRVDDFELVVTATSDMEIDKLIVEKTEGRGNR